MSYCSTVKTSLLLLLLLVSSPEVQGQTAQLRSVDCNRINTPLGLNLFANISGANQYKFKVKNLELGLTDSIVKPIDEMAAGKNLTSQIYQNLIQVF